MELSRRVTQSRLDSDICPSTASRIEEKPPPPPCTHKAGLGKSPGRPPRLLETADDFFLER
jgi:hypothetical protein